MEIQRIVQQKLAYARANADDEDQVPRVEITGTNYEVGGAKALASTIIGHLRTAFFILLFLGETCFQPFGGIRAMPKVIRDIWSTIDEGRLQYGMMAFFFGMMIQNSLL